MEKLSQYRYVLVVMFMLLLALTATVGNNMGNQRTALQPPSQGVAIRVPTSVLHPNTIATGEGSYTVPTHIPHQMRFVSPKLGISFLYLSAIGGKPPYQSISVKEVGNKIYVYDPTIEQYTDGQFFQVFQKDPVDSLPTAIQKRILAGYSSNDCFAKTTNLFPRTAKYQPTDEVAIISFPHKTAYMTPQYITASEKCPQKYTPTNFVSYFLMDRTHPGKLVFIYTGQHGMTSGEERTGEETLQILN